MTKKNLVFPSVLVLFIAWLWVVIPVSAGPLPQPISSPTPDADGRINYTVQENDTCLSIALRFLNGDVNKIIELNALNADCVIIPGQKLLLGIVEVPTTTKGPPPTATSNVPTVTPTPGTGEICVMLFNDINGNGRKDPEEFPMPGGAISITDRDGLTSLTGVTVIDADPGTSDEFEPLCFNDLPEGDYNISIGPPEGYNATTIMNYPLSLIAGDTSIVDFGAQTSSAGALVAQQTGPAEQNTRRSPLLGILGGILMVVGIGIGIYLWIQRR